ncbi:hypothetical protein AAF712_010601 [Marasmius tenuissimus]|uniref:DNA helicase n=1 Tax=Marasmius tenuissimus TaxID=585030 RepID=A0ABR2ZQ96_9AGAR
MSSSELSAFISRQRHLLALERAADLDRSRLLLTKCPPKQLERNGLALLGLTVSSVEVGLGGKVLVELGLEYGGTGAVFPPNEIRTGDLAKIEGGSSQETKEDDQGIEGVIYRISAARVVVALNSEREVDLPDRCRLVKVANTITYDRMDKAIDQLEAICVAGGVLSDPQNPNASLETPLSPLFRVLLGLSKLSAPDFDEELVKEIKFFDESLNDSQKEAVKFSLASREVACIHGPPGTGKTHTLIELIQHLVSAGKRILICGASNLAVDNILERLVQSPYASHAPDRLQSNLYPNWTPSSSSFIPSNPGCDAELVKDVKKELESLLGLLTGRGPGKGGGGNKGTGRSGTSSGRGNAKAPERGKGRGAGGRTGTGSEGKSSGRPKGAERKKMWEEVKALRREHRQRSNQVTSHLLSFSPSQVPASHSSSPSQVVLATCHSAGTSLLAKEEFDVVIIDEATQAMEAVTWIPILQASGKRDTKLILAGDPMQLGPTVLSVEEKKRERKLKQKKTQRTKASKAQEKETDSEDEEGSDTEKPTQTSTGALKPPHTLETTLFDRLEEMYGSRVKRMLQVQYRMNDRICEFPSQTLYDKKLISDPEVAERLLSDIITKERTDTDDIEDLETPVVFYDTAGQEFYDVEEQGEGGFGGGSRYNENEASVVKQWVTRLLESGIGPGQITVITPYQAQVTLLTSLLRPLGPIEIGTVDGMQGREKDAVIISLVRSNEKKEVGFLSEKRRLNVAMTRAKRHLVGIRLSLPKDLKIDFLPTPKQCVVGDSSTVSRGSKYLSKWMEWMEANADVRYAELT